MASKPPPWVQGQGTLTLAEGMQVATAMLRPEVRQRLSFVKGLAACQRERPLRFDFEVNRQRGYAIELSKEEYRVH